MPWWAWLAVGAALLATEVAIQTDFWLAVIGAAALVMGGILWLGPEQPVWAQWAGFAVLSVLSLTFARRRLHEMLGPKPPGLAPDLIGESGTAQDEIPAGGEGQVELRGSTWQARNVGEASVAPGAPVRVECVDGVVLEVSGRA